ncbi:MAG: hypothetical protein ACOCNB_10525 [Acetivibrio ethanolgignens]
MSKKSTKKPKALAKKTVTKVSISSDGEKPVWCFDKVDRDGVFSFTPNDNKFDSKLIMEKIISYSSMTWREILNQKHDSQGKSKNHYLSNTEGISALAKDRIKKLKLEEYTDDIFSFALNNTVRMIGLKQGEKFYPVWYDDSHKFYPSKK